MYGIIQDIHRFQRMEKYQNLLNVSEIERILSKNYMNMDKYTENEKHFDKLSNFNDMYVSCQIFLKTQKKNPYSFLKEENMVNIITHNYRFDTNYKLCDFGYLYANPNYMLNNWDYIQIIINRPDFLKRWKNDMGMNALHVAVINRNYIIVMFLITIGVSSTDRDIYGRTPLEYHTFL